ncbi:MAG: glycosyltransferase family 2 protein [Ahniella sp.]|nr:glycosyltransferase family 2 protein [Ahniella sp.]
MKLEDITAVVLCRDEQDNIGRTLERLVRFPQVVVLDSGSTDATEAIARSFPNVHWASRSFDCHANQWNHAVSLASSDWILSLDADYQVPSGFLDELLELEAKAPVYRAAFRFLVQGTALRAALLPPRAVLFRKSIARYEQDGHTQSLVYPGSAPLLDSPIDHDDRKPLSRWIAAQGKYMDLEAAKLQRTSTRNLDWPDRLRKLWVIMPWLVPLHVLFVRGALLDGMAGWHYALSRGVAEWILLLSILDLKLRNRRMQS